MGPQYHEDELFVTPKLRLSNQFVIHRSCAFLPCYWLFFSGFLGICLGISPWLFFGYLFGNFALVIFWVFVWEFRPGYFLFVWYLYGSFALFAVEQWPVPQKNDGDQLHTTIAVEYNHCSSTEPFACLRVCSWSTVLRVCWLRTQ